ncbi:MAG: hypothetical protein QOJ59_569 [Thermomicrobiales bacterium]|jgi:predicted DNA-binding transcriptional regulator AlpA|nr:hypothetical protein [Thermomicrobiales bacterium]
MAQISESAGSTGVLDRASSRMASERRGVRPRDLARQLGVAPNVIYTAINTGDLAPIWRLGKTGKAVVIPCEAVDRWLEGKAA